MTQGPPDPPPQAQVPVTGPALPHRVLGRGPLQVLHGACVAHKWPLVHMPGAAIRRRPEVDVLLTVTRQQAT